MGESPDGQELEQLPCPAPGPDLAGKAAKFMIRGDIRPANRTAWGTAVLNRLQSFDWSGARTSKFPSIAMQRLTRLLAVPVVVLALAADAAAVSVDEIVELVRAGLSDDFIVELIEADGRIHSLDADQIITLRRSGVSERIIIALARSGRRTQPVSDAAPEAAASAASGASPGGLAPIVVIIGGAPAPAPERESPVAAPVVAAWPYPVYVPVPVQPSRRHPRSGSLVHETLAPGAWGRFINDGFRPAPAAAPAPAAPVYWGWGGTLRPGAWEPAK
jgi:hypothetical protein